MSTNPVAHSVLGASNSKRWLACAGSVALAEKYPSVAGDAAREGTAAHAWAEYCLANGEVECDGYIHAEYPTAELAALGYPLTREMADAINVYLQYVRAILGPEDELHVERRVSLEFVAPGMFGTCDCIVLKSNGTLHVVDYKHGKGVKVDAEDNSQAKYYALGALHMFRDRNVTKVVTAIVQPRAVGGNDNVPQEFDPFELYEFGVELLQGAIEARKPDAPRVPGPHCGSTFCPGVKFGRCKEFAAQAQAVATDAFGEIIPPPTLTPAEVGARLEKLPLLKKWIEEFEAFAEAEAVAGRMPKGFKFVSGRGSRKWLMADDELIAAVDERTGVDISERIALSPAKAEKAMGKKLYAEIADFVVTEYGKPRLVSEADKRPALDLKLLGAEAFVAIEHPE